MDLETVQENITTVSVKFIRVKRDKCLEKYDIEITVSSANVQSCAQKQKATIRVTC